jgi:hypothetical protein
MPPRIRSQEGMRGSTQGEKNESSPAAKAKKTGVVIIFSIPHFRGPVSPPALKQGNSTYFFQSLKQLKPGLFFEEKITTKAPKAHKEGKIRLYTKTFFAADQRSDGALVVLRRLKVSAVTLVKSGLSRARLSRAGPFCIVKTYEAQTHYLGPSIYQ